MAFYSRFIYTSTQRFANPPRHLLGIAIVFWLTMATFGVFAADPLTMNSGEDRPKIGLALSGGGARGYAHIGVLKALRDAGIPIDYIAGTSIGAIFGGLYAMGYSPEEIAAVLEEVPWTLLLGDETPREHLVYRRKVEDAELTLDIELGIKKKRLIIPRGLSQGNQFKLLLRMLALGKGNRQQIEDLPIPFKAIATDIETGEMVVLDRGDIVHAIRASVSIPGVFSPVVLNDRLMSDGGMVRNLPIDEVREMGADIVIAVDISKPLRTGEELASLLAISSQAISLLTTLNVQKSLEGADIVITPDVGRFDFLDFSRLPELVEEGVQATKMAGPSLADLPRVANTEPQSTKPFNLSEVGFQLGSISFGGLKRVDPKRVLHQIDLRENQWVDYKKLQTALFQLEGMQDFDLIDFVFFQDNEGIHLVIDVREKPYAPHYLRFGWRLFSNDSGGLELEVLANQSTHPLNKRGGEWRNQLKLGRNYGFLSEFFQPFDLEERLFFLADVTLDRNTFNIFEGDQKLGEGDARIAQLGLALGVQLQNWGELRLGVNRGSLQARLRTGDPDLLGTLPDGEPLFGRTLDLGGVRTSFRVDKLDDAFLPNRGFALDLEGFFSMEELGGLSDYEKVELSYLQFGKVGFNVFLAGLDLGSALGGQLPLYDQFFGGGLQDFTGLQQGQINGSYKGIGRVGYFRLFPNSKSRSQIGGWVDVGNYWQDSEAVSIEDPQVASSIFYSRQTRLGPIYVGYGFAEGGHSQVFIAIGQLFRR